MTLAGYALATGASSGIGEYFARCLAVRTVEGLHHELVLGTVYRPIH